MKHFYHKIKKGSMSRLSGVTRHPFPTLCPCSAVITSESHSWWERLHFLLPQILKSLVLQFPDFLV